MPTPWQRDLEKDRRALETWLAEKLPLASKLRVSDLREPQSSGFSNDTLLFELEYERDGAQREELVVRIAPTGYQVFPEYDLSVQFRSMALLEPTAIPVPRVRWLEEERDDLLGADFYVMDRVNGRVPTDNPPYHVDGWLKTDATPAERGAIWWSCIDTLAALHRLDYQQLGFDFLDKPELGKDGLQQGLGYYAGYLEWAARGREQPTAEAAFEWLKKNAPQGEPDVLLWGDARIGNMIFESQGTKPLAVLDWEMVTHGSPEQDLAWAIFLDRHHSEGIETPRLEGFPSYEESVARYEELSGHAVRNLHYYQVFAGFRFSVIMARLAQQMVHYEVMDEEAGRNFEVNNTVTRLLAKLLELPPPGETQAGGFGE